MVYFDVDMYDHGCCGVPFKSVLNAIKAGCYMPYDECRIKKAFNFGKGTLADLKRFAKANKSQLLTANEFYSLLDKLPDSEKLQHINFINEMTHKL